MADWLRLAPPGGPERVQHARAAVQALAAEIPRDRQAIDDAKRSLIEAEAGDRRQLAQAMREGREAVSNVETITAAREQVAARERVWQGRQLAVESAQQEYRDEIERNRDQWLRTAQRDLAKSYSRATKAHAAFQDALTELGRARAIAWWLEQGHGFDRAQQWPSVGLLGEARSSAHAMANSSAASRDQVCAWTRELLGDAPARPEPQAASEPVPSTVV
jgi:hypothetical protein